MGVVYKAEDIKLGRFVALKFLPDDVAKDPQALSRFQREAKAAAKLRHPNIVAIHEIGEQAGQHFFAMDYVPGENLAAVARQQPFLPEQAAQITATWGERSRVETTVAIELALSWNPLMKSNESATATITRT